MKKCGLCQLKKPFNEFYIDKRLNDGHSTYCKKCACEKAKKWQKDNPEKAHQRKKKWGKENYERTKRNWTTWRNNNRIKVRKSNSLYKKRHAKEERKRKIKWEKANPDKVRQYRQKSYQKRQASLKGSLNN